MAQTLLMQKLMKEKKGDKEKKTCNRQPPS
jgi:hypothetical protein